MSSPARDRLRLLLAREGGPAAPAPDYETLAHLSDAWSELLPDLLTIGGGSPTIRALVAGLRDPWSLDTLIQIATGPRNDLLLREAAVWALSRSSRQPAEEALLSLLESSGPVRRTALRALARRGSDWALIVLDLELDPEGTDAVGAAVALAEGGHRAAVRLLLDALQEAQDPRAAAALGRLGIRAALPGLERLAQAPDDAQREAAAGALGELGAPAGRPALLALLHDPVEEVAAAAQDALALIYAPAGSPHDPRLGGHRPPGTFPLEELSAGAEHETRRLRYGEPWRAAEQVVELGRLRQIRLWPERLHDELTAVEAISGLPLPLDPFGLIPRSFEAQLVLAQVAITPCSLPGGAWGWGGEPLDDPTSWPA